MPSYEINQMKRVTALKQSISWEIWVTFPADGMRDLPLFAIDESF